MRAALSVVALTCLLTADCATKHMAVYPVDGQAQPIQATVKIGFWDSTSGTATAQLPTGERLTGRYSAGAAVLRGEGLMLRCVFDGDESHGWVTCIDQVNRRYAGTW